MKETASEIRQKLIEHVNQLAIPLELEKWEEQGFLKRVSPRKYAVLDRAKLPDNFFLHVSAIEFRANGSLIVTLSSPKRTKSAIEAWRK